MLKLVRVVFLFINLHDAMKAVDGAKITLALNEILVFHLLSSHHEGCK